MADWRKHAVCRGMDLDVFYPVPLGTWQHPRTPNDKRYKPALAICGRCPVVSDCLLQHLDEPDGVWGGTTPEQRKAVRQERALLAAERAEGAA